MKEKEDKSGTRMAATDTLAIPWQVPHRFGEQSPPDVYRPVGVPVEKGTKSKIYNATWVDRGMRCGGEGMRVKGEW